MTKLVDKLRKISMGETHRMGFGNVQAAAAKIPAIAIIASIPRPDVGLAQMALASEADAILIQVSDLSSESLLLQETVKAAGDSPCGVRLAAPLLEDVGKLTAAGADFLVLEAQTAPSSILSKEEIGRVIAIDPYLEDSLLRAIDRLAIDAVILELKQGNEEFLTVREFLACRRIVDMVRKPLILVVSPKLSTEDLVSIRDLGIESLLVDFVGPSSQALMSRLRAAIAGLPPRRKAKESRDVMLPRQAFPSKASEPEDDEL
ncbi:MAG: hypothetical protein Q7O66_02165 [Dehalococcoidia bacterium]|nr:hypothetical protein [Dehalococcoidia bacterium]